MVREYETELYEKQSEEVGRFSLKKRLTRKYITETSFQIVDEPPHRPRIHHALPTVDFWDKGHSRGKNRKNIERKLIKIKALPKGVAVAGGTYHPPHLELS